MGFRFDLRPIKRGEKATKNTLYAIRIRARFNKQTSERTFGPQILAHEWDDISNNLKNIKSVRDRLGYQNHEYYRGRFFEMNQKKHSITHKIKSGQISIAKGFDELFSEGSKDLVAPLVRKRNRGNVESVFKQLAEYQGYKWEEYSWSNVSHDQMVKWAKEKLKTNRPATIGSYMKWIGAECNHAKALGLLPQTFEMPTQFKSDVKGAERKYRSRKHWMRVVRNAKTDMEFVSAGFLLLGFVWCGNDKKNLLDAVKSDFVDVDGEPIIDYKTALKTAGITKVFYRLVRGKVEKNENNFYTYILLTPSVIELIEEMNKRMGTSLYSDSNKLFSFITGSGVNWWHNNNCNNILKTLNDGITMPWQSVRTCWANEAIEAKVPLESRYRCQSRSIKGSEQNYRVSKSAIPMLFKAQKEVAIAFDIKRLIFELKTQIWQQAVQVTDEELSGILKRGEYDSLVAIEEVIDW